MELSARMSARVHSGVSTPADPDGRAPRGPRWAHFRGLGLGLLLAVGLGLVTSQYLASRLDRSLQRTEALWNALEDSRALLGYAASMEAGYRGFLLTGDRAQLESYEAAVAEWPRLLGELHRHLAQREGLGGALAEVEQSLMQLQGKTAASLMLYETYGRAAALRSADAQLSKPAMDGLQSALQALDRHTMALLSAERQALSRLIRVRTLATHLILLLVAGLGVIAMLLGVRHFDALRAQARLREQVLQRQRESEEKSSFLAQASHEIRTPMNAIFGFSGLLHDRLEDPVSRRYIESIMSSARALLALINDLLDFTRIEAGRIEIRAAPTALREVVDGVVALFSQQAADKGLLLHAQIDADVPATVLADADRLRQMLVNLVSNAVKFTDSGEVLVHVSGRPEDAAGQSWRCVLEVRDTGSGIDADQLETIFRPFVQGRRREGGGTGLGLAITRQLALAMGGRVTAESEPGRGSVFRIVLERVPVARESPAGRRAGRLRDLPPRRFLVVDDVEMNRDLLQAMLLESQHAVASAGSGAEALEQARSFRPEVVLLDLRMPEMDGIEVARRLRSDPALAGVRIVAVTASNIASTAEARLFDALVLKPFSEDALYGELARLLGAGGAAIAVEQAGALTATPAASASPGDIIDDLERLLAEVWPDLRDTLTMSEVRQFAERVEQLARQGGLQPLQNYARKLGHAAGSFDVARAEALLNEYPARLAELRPGGARVAARA